MSKISFQVGNIDLIGESDVRRVCVESVSRSQPVELEREVNCAADGGGAEHCLENVGLVITMLGPLIFFFMLENIDIISEEGAL